MKKRTSILTILIIGGLAFGGAYWYFVKREKK